MTLRSLSSNRGGDEWTNGVTVGKKLGIQQFYKAFQAWIREMEALPSNLTGAGQSIDIPLASESVDEHGVGVT
jgi:hypothetical protein